MRKTLQAIAVWSVVLVALWLVWSPALALPQIWILVGISILANLLQPAYSLLERQRTREDRWTAVQILWTVYATQIAVLVELVVRRRSALPMDWVAWSAAVIMVAGLVLRSWSFVTLGRFFTWNVEVKPGQKIIRTGPYRFLRHPSYTGALMMFVASGVLLRSWVAALFAAIALVLAFKRRVRHEERLLKETFPDYDAYAARTGGLFPRLFS